MACETIRWNNDNVELIDQRLLPVREKYVVCRTAADIWKAIRDMKVRGAPAIGIAGAYGMYLGIRNLRTKDISKFRDAVDRVAGYLAGSRPTARNLFWALERMSARAYAGECLLTVDEIKKTLLKEAHLILEEDKKICREIGCHGKALIPRGSNVLTHCNAGGLATADYGTALGVIFAARKNIKMVYADETRPVLQGARLTMWELTSEGIPATLICDNMSADLMARHKIDIIIVGADRIAANGDTANKVGTYALAVIAKYHGIPIYIAAPVSTFDLSIDTGEEIPIEERPADEVRRIRDRYITVNNAKVYNPSFDVTPAGLITGIITERGVIRHPNRANIKKMLRAKR